MPRIILVLAILLAPGAALAQLLNCTVSTAGVKLRPEGLADPVGDILLQCLAAQQAPAGQSYITANVQIFLNTQATNRVGIGGDPATSDALLIINENHAAPRPDSAPGGPAANVPVPQFGRLASNSLEWDAVKIPIPGAKAPDGTTFPSRTSIRITNIRCAPNFLGPGAPILLLNLAIADAAAIQGLDQVLTVGTLSIGSQLIVRGSPAVPLRQCMAQNIVNGAVNGPPTVTVSFTEDFENAFRPLGTPSTAPGTHAGEDGYPTPGIGANGGGATQGTRLMVEMGNVPAGVRIGAPAVVTQGSLRLQLVQTDSMGAGAFKAVTGSGLIELTVSNGSLTAVYEVMASDNTAIESVQIPLTVGFTSDPTRNQPALGVATVNGLLAPRSTSPFANANAPIPRFADTSTFLNAFSIERCPPQTITTLVPSSVTVGDPPFTLTVNGAGFVTGSKVVFNDFPFNATFVSSTQLTAFIGGGFVDILGPGVYNITVVNPSGGVSNVASFTVKDRPPPAPVPFTISTVAGVTILGDGGPATAAYLRAPLGVAVNSSGNVYIADATDNRVRQVAADGSISTLAGNGVRGYGGDGGPAAAATLDFPASVALDGAGNLYVADANNNVVRRIATDGTVSTVAGVSGTISASGDGGPASQATLDPEYLFVDGGGNLYISDSSNNRIRMVSSETGIITTVAGSGTAGSRGDGGPATAAQLRSPAGIVGDASSLYICDIGNNVVRKVTLSTGAITTVAGNGNGAAPGDGGSATSAGLDGPVAAAIDSDGSLLILTNSSLRRVDAATGTISTIAGVGAIGFAGDGGAAAMAQFAFPSALAIAPNGDYLIADTGNYRIRRISNGIVSTIAGHGVNDGGPATAAVLNGPSAVATDRAGNIYIADTENNRIRKVDTSGVITTVAGTGQPGSSQGRISGPLGVAVDGAGNVYFSDTNNHRVGRITPAGAISFVAGNGRNGYSGDGGQATAAALSFPLSLAVDSGGNLYVGDYGNSVVRKVDSSGRITTVAGTPGSSFDSGSGGSPALQTPLEPDGLAVDSGGNLYIADGSNSRVLQVSARAGVASIVAGMAGVTGLTVDGPVAKTPLGFPTGVALGSGDNMYIADFANEVVLLVTQGTIRRIAGSFLSFQLNNEAGPALSANIDPQDVAVDNKGNVLVVDTFNDRIRLLTPAK